MLQEMDKFILKSWNYQFYFENEFSNVIAKFFGIFLSHL